MLIKAGLEIHQQLDSHKLFCNCPSVLRNDKPKMEVKRRLHAVAGESGEVDIAAKYEASKDKEFVYQFYDTNCLVELDEEPPHLINKEALKIALQIALFLKCEIVPLAQIMRKTVVDGSNTSGFQRTVLIARNGYVETKHGKVRIRTLLLEEDACRPASGSDDNGNPSFSSEDEKNSRNAAKSRTFKLDRLGIPMIEIATEPDIKSPEQAKEVALFIGDVLRSCKVRRGIGTIRQDVNVSIEGHPRVEVKGFQDVKMFIPVIENEVRRQEENLKSGNNLRSEVRNANIDGTTSFLRPMPGSARMYPETDLPLLRITKDIIDEVKREMPRLRSEIREEYKQRGLSEEMLRLLADGDKFEEFKALLGIINEPNFIAKVLLLYPNEIASHEKIDFIDDVLTFDVIVGIIEKVADGEIQESDVKHVMSEIAKGKSFDEAIKIERIDISDMEAEIAKIVKEKPGLSIGGYMGLIMQKFKGKISGKDATDILNRIIGKSA